MNQKTFYLVAIQFLVAMASGLSAQLQQDLSANTTRLQPHVLHVKKEIAGGSKIDLLTSNTKTLEGICSFDEGGKLDTSRAFIFDEISIGYASSTSTGAAGGLEYNTKAPKELQNADVVISQGDGKEIFRMPFRDLHNIQTGQKASDEYTELKALCGLKDNQTVKIQLQFPEGVSLPTVSGGNPIYHYVFLRMNGLQTVVNK